MFSLILIYYYNYTLGKAKSNIKVETQNILSVRPVPGSPDPYCRQGRHPLSLPAFKHREIGECYTNTLSGVACTAPLVPVP